MGYCGRCCMYVVGGQLSESVKCFYSGNQAWVKLDREESDCSRYCILPQRWYVMAPKSLNHVMTEVAYSSGKRGANLCEDGGTKCKVKQML